jgi:hypothetical protein
MSNNTTITAGVASGIVIRTTAEGIDPDFGNVTGLLPDCQYLRLKNADGSYAYVSLNELDLLRTELESKASAITVELMQSDIEDKVTKAELEAVRNLAEENIVDEEVINSILAAIDSKAEKTVVNGIATELLGKADVEDVNALSEVVDDKANKSDLDSLVADLNTLKSALGSLTDGNAIQSIQNQITYLNNEINKRLTSEDIRDINLSVTSMNGTVSALNSKVDEFESRLNESASAAGVIQLRDDVDGLLEVVNRLESKLASKADASSLASKASHSELLSVAERLTKLSNTVNSHATAHEDAINDVNNTLKNKVGKTELLVKSNELEEMIDLKADKSVIGPQIQELERDYNTLRQKVDALEDTKSVNYDSDIAALTNSVTTLNTKINTATTTTNTLSRDVDTLKSWKDTTSKQFKSQWVRVLSTKEYNSLITPTDSTIESYNDRYRYPNTVYLIVDYNTPKAIYIGDILLAKAEVKGSTGFAYAFPFTFPTA